MADPAEELGDVDLVTGAARRHAADRLHPEAAVLAAQPGVLDARCGDAVLEGEGLVGADVAVEAVGVPTGDLPLLDRRAQRAPARIPDDAEPNGATADPDRPGAPPGAAAEALRLVGLAAVDPGLGERRAGELVGPGRGEPALGADGAALDRREVSGGGGRHAVGQGAAVRGRRCGELRPALPVQADRRHRLPGRAALHLEAHLTADGDRRDGGRERRLGRVGACRLAAGLDDLRQRDQVHRLRAVRAWRRTGRWFADGSRSQYGGQEEQHGACAQGATYGHGEPSGVGVGGSCHSTTPPPRVMSWICRALRTPALIRLHHTIAVRTYVR